MRWTALTAIAAAGVILLTAWPADAQQRRGRGVQREAYPGERYMRSAPRRSRITVRRARSFLDPGTEVLPLSQNYTDYALPPLDYPTRIWDTTGSRRSPLPGPYDLPGWYIQ
jgi:hypothetical protein